MRTVLVAFALLAGLGLVQARQSARSPDAQPTFVEPIDVPHRHCGGSCLKSGELSWFCRLVCAIAPPKMHCHDPRP